MFKKIGILTSVSLIAFSALTADQMDSGKSNKNMDMNMFDGGWTMGPMMNVSPTGTEEFISVGYIDDMFLVDVGANYNHFKFHSHKTNQAMFLAHLGLRERLYQNLFVTYGAVGGITAGKVEDERPWSAGAFVGFDLQIVRHFLISAKINAFNYERTVNDSKNYEVFSSGTLALSYVF